MTSTRAPLPSGKVTFLFTDIEGSTRLASTLRDAFGPLLERHHALVRAAIAPYGGTEVSTEGDAFFIVFPSAPSALAAVIAAQRGLSAETWPAEVGAVRVRMGLHTGMATLGADNYVGIDVNRAARIAAAAHGGQVLLSTATHALVAGAPLGDVRFRDLGEYRLKDLDRPERLIQLIVPGLADEFPPPRTLAVPSNLPSQVTSFVGRDHEIEEIGALLLRLRLVTLTGPGGTGKTRLSLQVAEASSSTFAGGVFFVELAPIVDPGLIATTIAHAIGLPEEAARPVIDSLEDHLRDLNVLLVLDNFEQVVAGAPLVGRLLDAAPHLTVLATSREVLHLRGEQEYPVPPLGVPDLRALPSLEALAQNEAMALFIERAQAVRPDFRLDYRNARVVAAICARLDGLPLAIELAAARSKLFAPGAILARLEKSLSLLTSATRDLPERQRTLRGAIDWSYNLLEPTERTLFRRLAVFVGGSTMDSAQAVCDPDGELGIDVAEGLASFVDKSLLRSTPDEDGEPRFRMLETIREYGLERLAEDGDAESVRSRYEDYFAALAIEAEPELLGGRTKTWLDRLDREHDNLRRALQWTAADGRSEPALAMAAALWRFWQQRGHLAEGRESLTGLLSDPGSERRTAARASALAGLGGVAYWQGDITAAGRAYSEALDIAREVGDQAHIAEALYNAGFVAALTGDHATAESDYEEAMGVFEAIGDRLGVTKLREALVFLRYHQRRFTAARELQEQAVAEFRESGFRVANGVTLLAAVQMAEGDLDSAKRALSEAIGLFIEAGDVQAIVRVLILSAALAIASGDPSRAARASGAADVLREPLGDIATPIQLLRLEDPAVAARAALGDERFAIEYAAGRALDLAQMVDALRS
jgi:predicted ATPase/class 3 adenylate cyclase